MSQVGTHCSLEEIRLLSIDFLVNKKFVIQSSKLDLFAEKWEMRMSHFVLWLIGREERTPLYYYISKLFLSLIIFPRVQALLQCNKINQPPVIIDFQIATYKHSNYLQYIAGLCTFENRHSDTTVLQPWVIKFNKNKPGRKKLSGHLMLPI